MDVADEEPCNTIARRHRIRGHHGLRAFFHESAPTRRLDSVALG
jgi:hypothetical protein